MLIRAAIAAVLLTLFATPALAVGFTDHLDEYRADVEERRDEILPDTKSTDKKVRKAAKKQVKALNQILKKIDSAKTAKSYAREVKTASFAAKKMLTKLFDETELRALLVFAELLYFADVMAARSEFLATSSDKTLDDKTRRKARNKLDKGNKQLARIGRVGSLYQRLRKLAKAARTFAPDPQVGEAPESGVATWVVREFGLAPAGIGFDLDEDGLNDNALGTLNTVLKVFGLDLNAVIDRAIRKGDDFLIMQMWGIDSWEDDAMVTSGIGMAIDGDANADNNFGGEGVFDAAEALAPDGHPTLRSETSLGAGGYFSQTLTSTAIPLGDLLIPVDTKLVLGGAARNETNTGLISFGLPLELIVLLLEADGVTVSGSVRTALEVVQDLDLDDDGTNDALSVTLAYTAVPCTLAEDD